MKKVKKGKRLTAILLVMVLNLSVICPYWGVMESRAEVNDYGLSNPIIEGDYRDKTVTWDTIYFGNYWQNDTNGDGEANQKDEKEPIRWRVLSVEGDDAFLLADQGLDAREFDDSLMDDVTWENSSIREWLNSTFLKDAFTKDEQGAIRTSNVINSENNDNDDWYIGNDTQDKIYLLSWKEAGKEEYGQPVGMNNTAYAQRQGAWENSIWWSRSVWKWQSYVGGPKGQMYPHSGWVSVRPVLHLKLDEVSHWKKGETVCTDGKGETPVQTFPSRTPTPVSTKDPEFGDYGLKNPSIDANDATKWDTVYFGHYYQNDTNGDGEADQKDVKEPIRWRVLSVEGNDAYLMADQILDCMEYSHYSSVWEKSPIHHWLNTAFLDAAFSEEEQKSIRNTAVMDSEGNTVDKIYLLSLSELENRDYGFNNKTFSNGGYYADDVYESKMATHTTYAKKFIKKTSWYGDYGDWWLRDSDSKETQFVKMDGSAMCNGSNNPYIGVRPVLHLDLSNRSIWEKGEQQIAEEGTRVARPVMDSTDSKLSNPKIDDNGITTWDTIYFGYYWQNDTNGDGKINISASETGENGRISCYPDKQEPIRWRVLSVEGDDAYLLADQNLGQVNENPQHDSDVTWEETGTRAWLNKEFLEDAFIEKEAAAILDTKTETGTIDKIFLLSVSEAVNPDFGFADNQNVSSTRWAKNTEFIRKNSYEYNPVYTNMGTKGKGNGKWLLLKGESLKEVGVLGDIVYSDWHGVNNDCVRPVLHLDLSKKSLWSKGEPVTSEETKPESPTVLPNDHDLKNPKVEKSGDYGEYTVWDTIYMGNYWQNDTNGDGEADQKDDKEPIRWRVLSVSGDDAFLLSDQILDCQAYDDNKDGETWGKNKAAWEKCSLREWMNGTFLKNAFSENEQAAIVSTENVNEDGSRGTDGGADTKDKLFPLSISEATDPAYGFSDRVNWWDKERTAKNTLYASKNGAWESDEGEYKGSGIWRLRSPEQNVVVSEEGWIYPYGVVGINGVDLLNQCGIRPALHINLASAVWTKGESVTSERESEEEDPDDPGLEEEPSPTPDVPTPTKKPTETEKPTETIQPGDGNQVAPPSQAPVVSPDRLSSSGKNERELGLSEGSTSSKVPLSKPVIKSLKNIKGKKIKMKIKKIKKASGYQVQYAKNKKFKKAKKKNSKKNTITIKKLKKNKVYYFRIRSYILVGGKKVYSKWSNVKKVRIKK